MIYFEEIIEERKGHTAFDVPLWSASYQAHPVLSDTSEGNLRGRLAEIEKNIQFLSGSAFWNDALRAECGWQSPWWWFRARQFTLCELERRGMVALPAKDIVAPNKLHRDYLRRRKPLAVRISKIPWLLDLLDGKIRFGAASGYTDPTLQASQRDDEISRDIFFPGSLATITIENGVRRPLTGEIRLSGSRTHSAKGKTRVCPYWLLCFSTELDARLLEEFHDENPQEQGFFVLLDVEKFHRRVAEAVQPPELICGRVEVDYYDEHFPPSWGEGQFHVIGLKPFRFAYQRELRFHLLPDGYTTHSFSSHVWLQTEKMNDIAGVYNSMGEKEAGSGPTRLFS
ncbi:MAG: hypothetical protein QOD93_1565 [Acetobacteraceae bacterium]|jgi:hypothetical protein|nr:hypothetical protein [Acetobacteraceae bacterium]